MPTMPAISDVMSDPTAMPRGASRAAPSTAPSSSRSSVTALGLIGSREPAAEPRPTAVATTAPVRPKIASATAVAAALAASTRLRAATDPTGSPNGLGLGLSIVADIAKAHEADLEVRPRPDGGLTIAVSFPAALPGAFTLTGADRPGGQKLAVPGPLGLPAGGYADGSAEHSADKKRRAGSADPIPETEVMSCRQVGSP
jgi:hypothetical protein